jgi:hypothetical protein
VEICFFLFQVHYYYYYYYYWTYIQKWNRINSFVL